MNNLKKQKGGTIAGFIVGLILSLIGSFFLKNTIENMVLPFTNKSHPITSANQGKIGVSDPNTPLYGKFNKDAARALYLEQSKNNVVEEVEKSTEIPKSSDVTILNTDPEKKIENSTEEQIRRILATNSNEIKQEKKQAYDIETGQFASSVEAESNRGRLALLGLDSYVEHIEKGGKITYSLKIGPYSRPETLVKIQNRLSDNGIEFTTTKLIKK
jgi:cell division protein FtsN